MKRGEKDKSKGNERSLIKGDDQLQKLQLVVLKTGRAQAFRVIKILTEFLEWKTLTEIVDNKEYLNIPGVTTIEDYFNFIGLGERNGYNILKAGRSLSSDELQFCAVIGLTRTDLFTYASLPEAHRLQIKDGKVIGLENADNAEIMFKVKQIIEENQNIRDAATKVGQENDKLRKNMKELKARLPNQGDMDWAWLNMSYASQHISDFHSSMNLLLDSKDHRLVNNPEFKARLKALYDVFYRTGLEVFHQLEELTGYHPGREEGNL